MRNTVEIVGVNIDNITLTDAVIRIEGYLDGDGLNMIFTPNSEILVDAVKDIEFAQILNSGDLVVPDGIGVVMASKFYGEPFNERVAGYDLMCRLIELAYIRNKSIYFLGGKEGIAEEAAERLRQKYKDIKILGVHNGYFDDEEEKLIINDIINLKPDIVFVALGAPKQEKWIFNNRHNLPSKIAMGVGGSIDVVAGVTKRAPDFYQKAGLEWFYRLIKDPKRIFRIMKLPKFILLSLYDAKTK